MYGAVLVPFILLVAHSRVLLTEDNDQNSSQDPVDGADVTEVVQSSELDRGRGGEGPQGDPDVGKDRVQR